MGEVVCLYQLVEFIGEQVENDKKSIDCVPTKWIEFDMIIGQCFTKFMPPPYTKEKNKLLHKMIMDTLDPLDEWPRYPITIRGRAANFKEGMQRLKRLRVEDYAYTTGCEEAKEKAAQATHFFADRASTDKATIDIMNVPTLQMIPNKHESQFSKNPQQTSSSYSASSDEDSVSPVRDKSPLKKSRSRNKRRRSVCDTKILSTLSTKRPRKNERTESIPKDQSSTVSQVPIQKQKKIHPKLNNKEVSEIESPRTAMFANIGRACALDSDSNIDNDLAQPMSEMQNVSTTSGLTQAANKNSTKLSKKELSVTKSLRPEMPEKEESSDVPLVDTHTHYDMKLLLKEIRNIRYDQRQLIAVVNEMRTTLSNVTATETVPLSVSFDEKYKLQLPFATHKQFIEFDTKLSEDAQCRSTFIQALSRKFDEKKSITKNITAILKRYLSRDVALLYNAQKKVDEKFLFKDTKFSACLLDVIDDKIDKQLLPPVSDKEYLVHLGAVLSNVKDWGVPRAHQRPKKPSLTDENA